MPGKRPFRGRGVGLALLLATSVPAEADQLLDAWPAGTAPLEIGRRVAANFVARAHLPMGQEGVIHYAETATWYGALDFARLSGDTELQAQLVARFEPLLREEKQLVPAPDHVDYTVFGAVPLELYIQTGDQRYLALGEWMAQKQWLEPFGPHIEPAARENQRRGLSWQTRFWIDDMYMITLAQAQAYRATRDRSYVERAAREMVAYLERLQRPNGLFFHAPEAPFHWGRGNGWVAAGMAELLRSLPADSPARPRILDGYRLMMGALARHQDPSGMWRQLIDDAGSWPESSATGMFAFAFVTGVKEGWLDPARYAPAARRAWLALIGQLDPEANLREVCVGTGAGDNRQYYLDRPRSTGDLHGQAPILWCASALLR